MKKVNKIFASAWVCCGLATMFTACSKDKDFGAELPAAILVSADGLETNVGNSLTLAPGMSSQVNAIIVTEDVTYPELEWTVVDETVATVTQSGLVSAVNIGQTTVNITQKPNLNVLKSFTVNVKPVATAISLRETSLYQRTSKQLVVDVTPVGGYDLFDWSSSDESLATVDENGIITASSTKFGHVTITAKSKDGSNLTTSAVIEVKEIVAVTGIELDGPGYDLNIGDKGTVTTQLIPADATADLLEWTSSDEDVVAVNNSGVVTGVNYGTATITAKAESGVTQSIDITVGEGVINQDFSESMGKWTLGFSGTTNSFQNGYMTVYMALSGNYMGGIALGSDSNPVTINAGVYRYFAVKMTRPGAFALNWNGAGTIFLDTAKGRYQQSEGNGNNRYSILGYEGNEGDCPMDEPAIVYFDMQSEFGTSGYTFPTSGTESVTIFNIGIYDVPSSYDGQYNIYWIHTFKTLEEMRAFADNH